MINWKPYQSYLQRVIERVQGTIRIDFVNKFVENKKNLIR